MPCSRWDLSSKIRDQTRTPCIGSTETYWAAREVPPGEFLKPASPQALRTSHDSESYRSRFSTLTDVESSEEVLTIINTWAAPWRPSAQRFSPGVRGLRCPHDANGQQGDSQPRHLTNSPGQCQIKGGPSPGVSASPGNCFEMSPTQTHLLRDPGQVGLDSQCAGMGAALPQGSSDTQPLWGPPPPRARISG